MFPAGSLVSLSPPLTCNSMKGPAAAGWRWISAEGAGRWRWISTKGTGGVAVDFTTDRHKSLSAFTTKIPLFYFSSSNNNQNSPCGLVGCFFQWPM
ncbi:hypothetical protein Hanom_Chr04g00320271 [Helianthus anomalus]